MAKQQVVATVYTVFTTQVDLSDLPGVESMSDRVVSDHARGHVTEALQTHGGKHHFWVSGIKLKFFGGLEKIDGLEKIEVYRQIIIDEAASKALEMESKKLLDSLKFAAPEEVQYKVEAALAAAYRMGVSGGH